MGIREKLNDKIKKKEKEISEQEMLIREGRAYIQALQDTIKVLPKENDTGEPTEATLRAGSAVYNTCEFLRKAGKPLHVRDILVGIGKEPSKKERVSLSGSLAAYVRRNEIFNRPSPGTYGLIEFDDAPKVSPEPSHEPPNGFGSPDCDDDYVDSEF